LPLVTASLILAGTSGKPCARSRTVTGKTLQSPPVARQSAVCLPGGPGALLNITAIPSHNDRGDTAHVVRHGVGTPPMIGYDC
jgi:hypothetical protein